MCVLRRASLLAACLGLLLLARLASAQQIRQIPLATNDIIYDPFTQKIYASVPSSAGSIGNSITAIDPAEGAVGTSVFVGSEPAKLAISEDGRYVYVGLDGAAAVRRFIIPEQAAELQFPLGSDPFAGPFFVEDIEVQPGNLEVVAVSRRNRGFSPKHEGVAIYDNGVQRPATTPDHTGSNVIEFSGSASRLYGYNNETTEYGFRRMSVSASGVAVQDVADSFDSDLIRGFGVDIEFDAGRLYTTSGRAIDPEARVLLGTYPGVTSGALLEPDSENGRVFFLTGSGSTWTLRAFDRTTFLQVASLTVPGVSGTPGSLIRWGEDGLAFRTSGGQVFLIQSSELVPPPEPAADLSITQTDAPDPVTAGADLTYTVTITNNGPETATGVAFADTLPAGATFVSATSSQGTLAQAAGVVSGSLGSLEPEASATITIVVRSPTAGTITNTARVAGVQRDPDTANNTAAEATAVLLALRPNVFGELRLATNDIVYDPFTRKIYASVPGRAGAIGNSIVPIDPLTAALGAAVPVGSEPGRLALADNGQYLYTTLEGGLAVRRLNIPEQTAELQFSLGAEPPPSNRPFLAQDLEVLPGNPGTVAVARQVQGISSLTSVAIYDDGVPRPATTPSSATISVIEAASAERLYGYNTQNTGFEFSRLSVGPSGVSVADSVRNLISGFNVDIEFGGGLIYATSGSVIDPEARLLLGTFSGVGSGALVEPDSAAGRVFFLTGSGATRTLQAFDTRTFLPVGSLTVSGVSGAPGSLIRWGADGLAFRTSGGQVFLVRTSLIPVLPLYRLDTPEGLNLLTADESERDFLLTQGWGSRGPVGGVFTSPGAAPGLVPLYRLYDPASGDHFFTVDEAERDAAVAGGSVLEGDAGYVFTEPAQKRTPLYRAYNTETGQHLYTSSEAEYNALSEAWQREGITAYLASES